MTDRTRREQLNAEILESVSELIGRVIGHGEQLAQKLCIPIPFIKALHTMECPMAMKDLGKRMRCDPSFVTLVADMLEKRGLARREPQMLSADNGAGSADEPDAAAASAAAVLAAAGIDPLGTLKGVLAAGWPDPAPESTPPKPPVMTGEVTAP